MYSLDWTTIGTVLTHVFTGLLVVLGWWAGWQARSAAKAAWENLKAQEERRRAAQAGRVYCSPVKHRLNASHLDVPSVTVTNASSLPIYDVVVAVKEQHTGNSTELSCPSIMPGEHIPLEVPPGVLTREWGWIEHDDSHGIPYYSTPDDIPGPSFIVSLGFRDATNQRWQRDLTGFLSRVSD
jgi:hypothetical protein